MLLCVSHYYGFSCVYHILDAMMIKAVIDELGIFNSSSKVVRIRNGVGILPGT